MRQPCFSNLHDHTPTDAGAVSYSQSSNVELGQSWQYRVYSSKGIIRAIIAQSQ